MADTTLLQNRADALPIGGTAILLINSAARPLR